MNYITFAHKLADATFRAINSGYKIGNTAGDCRCPLGCLPGVESAFPNWNDPSILITGVRATQFLLGFEFGAGKKRSKYARLGRLYRERFVHEALQ